MCTPSRSVKARRLARAALADYAARAAALGGYREMGLFVAPVIRILIAILDIYWWLVIIQAIASWLIAFNILNTYSRPVAMILDFLYRATEPALRPIRRFVPPLGGLDVTPIILLLLIWLVEMWLAGLEVYLAAY